MFGRLRRTDRETPLSSQQYWSDYNVTGHRVFDSRDASLRNFHWRVDQYYDYLSLMPVGGQDGKVVLDYGCGPGHDLVGFAEYSTPLRLIGIDVSRPSLDQARQRLALHGCSPELTPIDEDDPRLPLPDNSVDHVHSSGVLHHVPDPINVLREFRRILTDGGAGRLMVYNYNCVWLHQFAAYEMRFNNADCRHLAVREAFKRCSDTAACPISHAWTVDQVREMGAQAGLRITHLGNAAAAREVAILPRRFDAILEEELEREHRQFLLALTFDERGIPYFDGQVAGIDACYEFRVAPRS